jgi:signal transduction histidine kinase
MATIARPASPAGTLPLGRSGRVWSRIGSLESHRSFWIALWAAGAAGALGALWPVLFGDRSGVTATEVTFRATGGSFVAAGLIAWQLRPANRVGALMVATGFLLYVQPLESLVGSSLVQTFGVLITDFWTIPFVVLLLVFPQGRWLRGGLEWLLVAAFAVPLVAQPFWMLFGAEPGFANDLAFWPNDRAADWIDKGQRGVLLGATASLFLVVAWRWWRASAPLRRVLLPVLAGGATVLSFAVLLALDLINGTRSQTQLTITLSVLATVPFAFLAGLLRSRLARVAVGDLLVGLRDNPSPIELREALARSLGDPSLDLVYWLPDFGKYADLDGHEVDLPGAAEGRAVTPIDAGGVRVAALLHDPALVEEPALLEGAAAAASIALENAQLHVELQARLEELRGSRARIVEVGQRERQRLERNLHDGAQQRLVALSLELSMLEGQVAHDPDARERVERARSEIAASLAELRELARGLHPAVVSAHGLDVALEQIAARAPVPVRLRVDTAGRLPEPLEVATFYLVSESLANVGKYAEATKASVDITRADGRLVVEVVDDGIGGANEEQGSGLRGLADRVEALDGRLRVWSPQGGGTRVQAEIPCGR